jgi:hypothetical protein
MPGQRFDSDSIGKVSYLVPTNSAPGRAAGHYAFKASEVDSGQGPRFGLITDPGQSFVQKVMCARRVCHVAPNFRVTRRAQLKTFTNI